LPLQPRFEVENLKVCPHGGPDYGELKAMGLAPEEVLDFSVSSNPFPPPPEVRKVVDTIAIDRYPDSEANELKRCLSEMWGVATDNILAGNGSVELIRLIALAYFRHGDPVLIFEPTFGEYEVSCKIVGAEVTKQWRKTEEGFTLNIGEATDYIKQCHPRGVFLCNPNNPTGDYLSRREVEQILESSENSLLILDEAFVAFVDESWSSIDLIHRGNVIIVRSMTKDYGLAGLRLGYAIAHQEVIDCLRRVCLPWNVNAVAQKAGVVALEAVDYFEQCKQKVKQAKQFLVDELCRIGFTCLPSKANYFLVRVGDAGKFRKALLKHGILVRDCSSFGLPDYIRIAPRTMAVCRKLITTIETLKRNGELAYNT